MKPTNKQVQNRWSRKNWGQ